MTSHTVVVDIFHLHHTTENVMHLYPSREPLVVHSLDISLNGEIMLSESD